MESSDSTGKIDAVCSDSVPVKTDPSEALEETIDQSLTQCQTIITKDPSDGTVKPDIVHPDAKPLNFVRECTDGGNDQALHGFQAFVTTVPSEAETMDFVSQCTDDNEDQNRQGTNGLEPFAVYKMDHGDRGFALIINNREFKIGEDRRQERRGTDMDLKKMRSLLTDDLGFRKEQVTICHNATERKMKELIKKAVEEDYGNSDCFICVILTYGNKYGDVYGRDKEVKFSELIELFKKSSSLADKPPSSSLAGKPKIFIIQECPYPIEKLMNKTRQDGNENKDGESNEGTIYPEAADFLVVHSSIKSKSAILEVKDTNTNSLSREGSCFIQTLSKVVKKGVKQDDFQSLLTKVNSEVAKKADGQVACINSMLTKKVVFFNGRSPMDST